MGMFLGILGGLIIIGILFAIFPHFGQMPVNRDYAYGHNQDPKENFMFSLMFFISLFIMGYIKYSLKVQMNWFVTILSFIAIYFILIMIYGYVSMCIDKYKKKKKKNKKKKR